MKLVLFFSLLAVVCFVNCSAEAESDTDLERSPREAVIGKRVAKHRVAPRKPAQKKRPRKILFKTRKNKFNRKHYEQMLGFRPRKKVKNPLKVPIVDALRKVFPNLQYPENFSWLDKPNVVGPIKDQGSCGSCYAFASVCALESMIAIWKKSSVLDLSEQEIVDCSTNFGNMGCRGGIMESVYRYIASRGGDKTEKTYPYHARKGKCRKRPAVRYGRPITFSNTPYGDEESYQQVIHHLGPITIAIRANCTTFMDYASGIYNDEECIGGLDHAVVLVGWGVENGEPYWILRNSWGTAWGENGYAKIARGIGQSGLGKIGTVPLFKHVSDTLLSGNPIHY